jgi:selenocysteine lyase/cysteine desulfurase
VEVRFIGCTNGLPDEAALLRALDDKRVRAVAVSWVQFSSGYRVDLARLGAACSERGVFLAVDGIQGLGAVELDLAALQVDVFESGCQKWMLSPWGCGFAYVRGELIARLEPVEVGWLAFKGSEDFSNVTRYEYTLRDDARRFEVGTIPLQDFAGMNASVQLFLELGVANVAAHIAGLTRMLTDWAQSRGDVRVCSPLDPAKRAGIVSLAFPDTPRVATALRDGGVTVSVREGAVRFSCHLYNTSGEIARVTNIIEGALR